MSFALENKNRELTERIAQLEAENKKLGEKLVASVCKECKCENIVEHNRAVGKRKLELEAENKKLIEQLSEFKSYGTDECPDCETAPIGMDYNRTTLFYRPKEHELHLKQVRGE